MYGQIKIITVSDSALSVEFGNEISEGIHNQVYSFCQELEGAGISGIIEWIPAYCSVLVLYQPEICPFKELKEKLLEIIPHSKSETKLQKRLLEIPVLYGGEHGPDLNYVASFNKLTPKQVIEIHSSRTYLIYMLGFTPGFPYLGGMDERIATPRLDTPRVQIPASSVGIAGKQTGIYPIASPGGWQLIGSTPLILFDPAREQPFLLRAGDQIRFIPITEREYHAINLKSVST